MWNVLSKLGGEAIQKHALALLCKLLPYVPKKSSKQGGEESNVYEQHPVGKFGNTRPPKKF